MGAKREWYILRSSGLSPMDQTCASHVYWFVSAVRVWINLKWWTASAMSEEEKNHWSITGKKHPNIHSIVCNLHDFTWFELRRTPATLRLHHFAKDLRQAALGLRSTSHLCKAAYHEVVRRTPDAVAPPVEVVRILRSDVITEDMVFVMHCGCVNFT